MWQIEQEMPASEFKEWLLLEAEEPFGDRRADYHAALIAFSAAKHAGNKKSSFSDYLLFRGATVDGSEGDTDQAQIRTAAAQVQEAFLKASSRLKKRVLRRKK